MFDQILNIAQHGFGMVDSVLTINRLAVGLFFAISGYHKLFNKTRHESVVKTLQEDGVPFVGFNQWFVPSVEFMGGTLLTAGIFSPVAALFLGAICLVATCVDGIKRVLSWKPLDKADLVDDVLYLPEVLYGIMLLVVIFAGPGCFAVA